MELNALRNISYGLYIISSVKDGKFNGQAANAVLQVTSEPPVVVISINKNNLTHEFIETSKCFSVSVLNTDADFKFIGGFGFKSGRDVDKFEGINYKVGITGAPIVLDRSSAWLEFEVTGSMDVGTHTLFMGKLVDSEVLNDKESMTYAYYHKVVKGKSPKAAPTYIPPEK
jgi:ferric-chelate reductase [NAD(P)H]